MGMTTRRRGSMKVGMVMAVAAVVAIAVATALVFWPWDPRPSGRFKAQLITVSLDLSTVITLPSGSGDGAEDAHKAVKRFLDKSEQVLRDRWRPGARTDTKDLPDQLAEIYGDFERITPGTILPFISSAELLAAAEKGEFHYDERYLPTEQEWRLPTKLLRAFEWVAKAAILEGKAAEKRGDRDKAEKIYRAVLIYGNRLAKTDARVWIQLEGLNAQCEAAEALNNLWDESEPRQAEKVQAAVDYRRAVRRAWGKTNEALGSLCYHLNRWHAGDLLFIARKHPDVAWRVEATLALGMARHNKSARKYKKAIMRYLNKAASDENARVAAAAAWSRDLTEDVYNTQTAEE